MTLDFQTWIMNPISSEIILTRGCSLNIPSCVDPIFMYVHVTIYIRGFDVKQNETQSKMKM